jgi:hypothetical protein
VLATIQFTSVGVAGSVPEIITSFPQTQWRRALLEKLIVTQLVKKFPAFYVTGRFITVFTRTHR